MSRKKNTVEDFGVAEMVANHLLYDSFLYIHEAAQYEVAGDLFSKKLSSIEPDPLWNSPEAPEDLLLWLKNKDEIIENVLDPVTTEELVRAWDSSLELAIESGQKLSKKARLTSTVDIVRYAINLTVCLESVLNRYLFFLKETNKLSDAHYNYIDRSEIMPKLLFCFKEEILEEKIKIDRIKQLVSMRNNSVHYRISSPKALQPSIEDVLGIWNQIETIFFLVPGEPSTDYLKYLVGKFIDQWIS